jgi:hypothetical protein
MTGPSDLIGSLSAAVDAYQTAQAAMVAASQELAAESAPQGDTQGDESAEGGNGGLPA